MSQEYSVESYNFPCKTKHTFHMNKKVFTICYRLSFLPMYEILCMYLQSKSVIRDGYLGKI